MTDKTQHTNTSDNDKQKKLDLLLRLACDDFGLSLDLPICKRERYDKSLEEIVLIFGCSGTGKSTYISLNYDDTNTDDIIDIIQFQHNCSYPGSVKHQLQTYLSNTLLEYTVYNAISDANRFGSKTGRIVVEGTYLRQARRAPLIQTIMNCKKAETKLICYFMTDEAREQQYQALDSNKPGLFDLPTLSEGYDELYIVHKDKTIYTEEELSKAKVLTEARKKINRISDEDIDMLGYKRLAENEYNRAKREFEQKQLSNKIKSKICKIRSWFRWKKIQLKKKR